MSKRDRITIDAIGAAVGGPLYWFSKDEWLAGLDKILSSESETASQKKTPKTTFPDLVSMSLIYGPDAAIEYLKYLSEQ